MKIKNHGKIALKKAISWYYQTFEEETESDLLELTWAYPRLQNDPSFRWQFASVIGHQNTNNNGEYGKGERKIRYYDGENFVTLPVERFFIPSRTKALILRKDLPLFRHFVLDRFLVWRQMEYDFVTEVEAKNWLAGYKDEPGYCSLKKAYLVHDYQLIHRGPLPNSIPFLQTTKRFALFALLFSLVTVTTNISKSCNETDSHWLEKAVVVNGLRDR